MFELRQYQQDAVDKCYQRIDEGHRPIICAPTGSGKTIIAGYIAQIEMNKGKRILFMSGRREILRQTYNVFAEFCGLKNVGFLMAGEKPWWFYPPVTVASWDTLKARWARSDTWKVPADVVVYDECHLALSDKMVKTILPYYKDKMNIGLTATPAKQSGKGLGSHFTRIIQVRSVQQIIDEGYLAACEYWAGSYADVSKVKTVAGDFQQKGLATVANDNVLVGDVVDNWLRLAKDRHTIVFAVDIAHAVALTERFQAADIRAEVLHSKLMQPVRSKLTDDFREQRFQVLVNVGIATYGYDVPSVSCIVLARPTKSIVLHLQMIGRGMRPKDDSGYCMVLDHADNVRRLGAAEDPIRWTLNENRNAATNYKRHLDDKKGTHDAVQTVCENCTYLFTASRICPKCGWEKPIAAKDIETVHADLVKVRHARAKTHEHADWPDDRTFYLMLVGYGESHEYKSGWSFHKFMDLMERHPENKWRGMAGIPPNARVSNWIRSQQIRYAKRRKRKAA